MKSWKRKYQVRVDNLQEYGSYYYIKDPNKNMTYHKALSAYMELHDEFEDDCNVGLSIFVVKRDSNGRMTSPEYISNYFMRNFITLLEI